MPLPERLTRLNNCWIETASGNHIDAVNPNPLKININDIAHALSMQCRFVGHCKKFYSVAEHSCFVANIVNGMVARELGGEKPKLVLRALLHDAAEAYVGDLARPYKILASDLREVELNLQEIIYKKFMPASRPESEDIKLFDEVALILEAKYLMPSHGNEYEFKPKSIAQAAAVEAHEHWRYWYTEYFDTKYKHDGTLPIVAKNNFLNMFHHYYMTLNSF